MGININDSAEKWTEFLLTGKKTIETRNTNSLKPYIGKVMGIIRTGVGKAHLVGIVRLGEPIVYATLEQFRADADRHGIEEGSGYDWKGCKYGYPVEVLHRLEKPAPVESLGIIARKITPYEVH